MRGLYSSKTDLRRKVFTEVARFAYEGGSKQDFEEIPFKILPGEVGSYRDNIFLERAILGERLRTAMGMPVRTAGESGPISTGIDDAEVPEHYYTPPLINVIKFACHACPEKQVIVTNGCQGCLEHPCMEMCPKKAISIVKGKSYIDQSKCIKCGRCVTACPYSAIIKQERPCTKACGAGAIKSDEKGRAEIDYDKCVSCGQCLVSCPFAAIVDKSQIYQTITALKSDTPVYAAVVPAFAGQFSAKRTDSKVRAVFKRLGFEDAVEVAIGADLCAIAEARDFVEEVPSKLKFMATSCCPAWAVLAKKTVPQFADNISMALTPMVLTARLIKKEHPGAKVAFIGPCAAKKLEAMRRTIRSDVDFVLTFEEVQGIMDAKGVSFDDIPESEYLPFNEASGDGCGFAVSGGVAQAVKNVIAQTHPEMEVKVARAEGLADCKKMLLMAKAGKYDGYLLEGMGCPGGCVGGAGSIVAPEKAAKAVAVGVKEKSNMTPFDSKYASLLTDVEERETTFNSVFSTGAAEWERKIFND
ncbi:MAG: 4Fe-4S dicluster domain-containing protein [Clostridiales bacterium]|nr:4Fe-4S dicluster domain-containing protein [Clostridiales bacterium]